MLEWKSPQPNIFLNFPVLTIGRRLARGRESCKSVVFLSQSHRHHAACCLAKGPGGLLDPGAASCSKEERLARQAARVRLYCSVQTLVVFGLNGHCLE
ncbi:hypothetical protein EYF80_046415 [Liparis tanakae]|uniref:Uncharacterized protein n=1 Tax=Liparis tanakae TaxID=230148 RepID=A0A4Z2FQY7_9TELE|nr:hypothetical protein EYF80_046415 [Liparis tanakae]